MQPKEMESACLKAMESSPTATVTLSVPKGTKLPHGFPQGELLSENKQFVNRAYKPEKVLRWLRDNLLIEAVSDTAPSRTKQCITSTGQKARSASCAN